MDDGFRSFMGGEKSQRGAKIPDALTKVGGIYGISAFARAYFIAKAARVFAIVSGRKVEQLKNNIKALEIELTDQQIEESREHGG